MSVALPIGFQVLAQLSVAYGAPVPIDYTQRVRVRAVNESWSPTSHRSPGLNRPP